MVSADSVVFCPVTDQTLFVIAELPDSVVFCSMTDQTLFVIASAALQCRLTRISGGCFSL